MDWKSIKKQDDVKLAGITVSINRVDGSIRDIELSDGNGGRLQIHSVYGLTVSVPKEAEKKAVSVIRGTVAGVPIETIVDAKKSDYEVTSKTQELERSGVEEITITERMDDIPF